jgi:heat shock protein HslJ
MFLKAYASARKGDVSRPWNVTTIHTQFLRKDQIPSFVKYGIRPSFYTLHTYYFADAHIANRGRQQASFISPMRDAINAGLRPTNHTDFVVAPLDQLFMLWSAVNRVSRSGETIGPDQRVSPYEGLKAMTAWAAAQYGEQENKGTLEVGKLADLVILDRDPLQVAPNAIKDIKVAETIKEGVTIYPQSAAGLRPIAAAPSTKTYRWTAHSCDMDDVNQAAGREWTLVSLLGQPVSTAKPPTLRAAAGRLTIFGGINRLNGSVALVRDQLVIGDLVSTRMAGPPELMALEERFAGTLRTVNRFHVRGSRLELLRDETVVPNHPYSRWFTHADYDAMNKWGVDVSQRVWRALLTPSNATILVVGNVKVEDVKAQAQTYWGGWGGWRPDVKTDLAPVTEYPAPTAPGKRRVIVINKDNSSQTDANYLCQIGPVSTMQRPAAQVLGNALSEGAWLALREQTGASYGAYAYTQVYRGGLAFLGMSSLVQNDASGLAVQAFLGLGEDAKAGKVNPKLVKLSQYNIAQSYVQGHQSSQQMFNRLRSTWELGAGWDWFKTYPKALSTVTVQEFPAMMERCVGHETITLVGPKEAVSASLDKVGVAYEVFDWKQAKLDYATKQDLKDVLKAEEKRKKDEAKKKADEEKKKATTTK